MVAASDPEAAISNDVNERREMGR